MKHLTRNPVTLLLLFTLIVLSCKDAEPEKEAFIRAPFPNLDPEYTNFSFAAEKGGTFSIESGTTLAVPPDIWQNAEGEAVKGDITLKYREFHDALDIFLSGSSLDYDTAGVQEVFTTAGMFELRAFKDSSEIFIKPDKSMEVKMASYKSDPDFNFYSLDEEAGNWEYAGRSEPEVNPKLQEITDSISKLKSTETINLKESKMFALNYNGILDIYFRNKRIDRESKAPKRKAEKYGLAYSSINGYQDVYFRGIKYQAWEMVWKLENSNRLASWTKKGAYIDKLTLLGNNSYYMKIKSGNDKSITYKVKAVMPLKVLFATAPERWQEEYEQVLERLEEEQRRLDRQAEVFRTFSVNATGFYNWDRIMKMPGNFYIVANYDFDQKPEIEFETADIFYFTDNKQNFTRFKMLQGDSIRIAPDTGAIMLAVVSPTQAAICRLPEDTENFSAMQAKGTHTFDMKTIEIHSKDDLLSILEK
jgi:hypothetical protein